MRVTADGFIIRLTGLARDNGALERDAEDE